jgi:hypothetical protein
MAYAAGRYQAGNSGNGEGGREVDMTSSKQVQSNRQNALKSTGPKTPEGKAVVSQNAVKHGLLAREVLLEDESPQEWELFMQRVFMALEPAGEMEALLAERISACAWRLRRILSIESGILDEGRYTPPPEIEKASDDCGPSRVPNTQDASSQKRNRAQIAPYLIWYFGRLIVLRQRQFNTRSTICQVKRRAKLV